MARLSLNEIKKEFGETKVLKGVSLDIQDGEFISLVGPSGCGKSTLLRIIAGLELQTSGDILIDGTNVNQVRATKRNLSMVFQSYALYPHLTVGQNMMVPLRMRRLTSVERLPAIGMMMPSRWEKMRAIHKQVRETAETLKITELLGRKPGELSGGQRQRVAVGRAMVRQPVAFLMDEPLSNLDAALRVHMRAEIADLHRQLKTTFIYVTHDQAEALTMSDRIAVMMEGNLLQVDTPDEIYANPIDMRVAQFIGSPKMNILPGAIDSQGQVSLPGEYKLLGRVKYGSGSISVGLRPEHLDIGVKAPNGRHLSAIVRHKENLGADYFIHAELEGGDQKIVVRAVPDVAHQLSIGSHAEIWQSQEKASVFGKDNRRLQIENEGA
nr:ABC transporter ATP-binding protein [uncultured Cohaesibacter sp.]